MVLLWRQRVASPNPDQPIETAQPTLRIPFVAGSVDAMTRSERDSPQDHVRSHDAREHGAVTILIGAAVVIVGYLVLQVTQLSVAAADRARAQTAADAAALGGVIDGPDAARALVTANGATLIEYSDEGDQVQVQVAYNDAVATARAERTETSPFS